jgi:lipid biosynthesis B12-binding/radical SAM protein
VKRILVASSNITKEPFPVYPLGLAVVASAFAAAGHLVEQFDYLASGESEARWRAAIAAFAPDYICLSVRNLDNCDSINPVAHPSAAGRMVEIARQITTAPIIIGGPAVSILPEEMIEYTGADYAIVGEGEQAACSLIRDLSQGRPSPRVVQAPQPLAGGDMAPPLFSGDLASFYLEQGGMLNLQTKRGCPYRCAYCSYPSLEGRRFRYRDPAVVVDDLERAKAEHGADSFFFTDSIFNDPQDRYLAVAEEMLRRAVGVRWCCYMRPSGLGRSDIALLMRAGLYAVELGTDATTDTTLRELDKGFSFAEVLEVNRACVAERLPCAHFVMFGGPGETTDTVAEGLANLEKLEHCVVFAYSGIRILPGTALHARAVADGVIPPGIPFREPVHYVSPQVDAAVMNRMLEASFRGRRDRIFPPAEGRRQLELMRGFGFRGLLWDRLIRFPSSRVA